ncbi:hypothetical protein M2318_001821 [Metapseudomonas resinovorans]
MQMPSDTHPNYVPDSSYGLFIGNPWVVGESGETLGILNPANDPGRCTQRRVCCLPSGRRT